MREFGAFIWGQIRASGFALFIFASAYLTQFQPLPRYDVLLALCLGYQFWLLKSGRESKHESIAICAFHILGVCLELYKVRLGSWSYPEFAYSKFNGVPLFSGFMYASVASYVFRACRIFDLKFEKWPSLLAIILVTAAIYSNFYLNRYFDSRWWIAAATLLAFARTKVHFQALPERTRWMPMPLSFLCIGFFVWMAEHVCTYLGIWVYPHQREGWEWVSLGKLSSWVLLTVVSVSIAVEWKRREPSIVQQTSNATEAS